MPQVLNSPSKLLIPESWPYISYEEFLDMDLEETPSEWVHGRVERLHLKTDPLTGETIVSVSLLHNLLTGLLYKIISYYVESKELGTVLYEPYLMKTARHLPGRSPDIFYVSNENLSRMQSRTFEGPADLVIEVVSEESISRDKISKLAEYEEGGVREYWIIDPLQNECLFYRQNSEGRFDQVPADEKGIYRSQVLKGLWIDVNWFCQDPFPTSIEVLKLWGMIPSILAPSQN